MTKDLSKILCEIAGIEAKTFKECQRGERFMGECPLSYCTSLGCSLKEYKLYPNFEIPENFVKLLEVNIGKGDNKHPFHTIMYFYSRPSQHNVKDFLENLVGELSGDCIRLVTDEIIEATKQALQAEKNWRY